jgi:F420-non-reducing hydrogenase large subunit
MIEDHTLHFFFLGGPDFIVGPSAPAAERNILGVLGKVGPEIGMKIFGFRREMRDLIALAAGKTIHPVFGLPGGISKPLTEEERKAFIIGSEHAVEFGLFSLKLFRDMVRKKPGYIDLITSDAYSHKTYYMGLVDKENNMNFYDGTLRIISPDGAEFLKFSPREYLNIIAEHVEPWTYVKFCYLKHPGWNGFSDGEHSGIYSVAPLARLNASEGISTPEAQAAYEEFFQTFGGKPVHHTLANHWARLIEIIYAAERMSELARDPEILDSNVRNIPKEIPKEGIAAVEAPRGTLFHHYRTDERGIIRKANLIVATQNNAARIALSVDKAAREFISNGKVDEGILNRIEMAFRAYDPCIGCASHCLTGQTPFVFHIYNKEHRLLKKIETGEMTSSPLNVYNFFQDTAGKTGPPDGEEK